MTWNHSPLWTLLASTQLHTRVGGRTAPSCNARTHWLVFCYGNSVPNTNADTVGLWKHFKQNYAGRVCEKNSPWTWIHYETDFNSQKFWPKSIFHCCINRIYVYPTRCYLIGTDAVPPTAVKWIASSDLKAESHQPSHLIHFTTFLPSQRAFDRRGSSPDVHHLCIFYASVSTTWLYDVVWRHGSTLPLWTLSVSSTIHRKALFVARKYQVLK